MILRVVQTLKTATAGDWLRLLDACRGTDTFNRTFELPAGSEIKIVLTLADGVIIQPKPGTRLIPKGKP